MDFLNSLQVSADSLETVAYDLFIAVSGYEERCTYLSESKNITAQRKVVLAYKERNKDLYRKSNDKFFRDNAFEFIELSGYEPEKLISFLKDLFIDSDGKKELRILVDYSCMTKTWYSSILSVIQDSEGIISQIRICFVYCPSKYEEPVKTKNLKKIYSDYSKGKLSDTKPTVLIIGLGVEKSKAEQVVNFSQPDLIILMYPDPGIDDKYTRTVFKNNADLIQQTAARNLINYPITDAESLNQIVTSKCVELRLSYNIIIAPLGPKIFALNAFLLSSRYPDINVWNFSTMQTEKPSKSIPSGEIIAQEVIFIDDDELL